MKNFSVVFSETINKNLLAHLIRDDGQEDLCFALYKPSTGKNRKSGIISEIILPIKGDRNIHGNASFNSQYFDRVSSIALEKGFGICFLHSHPGKGWQNMSDDDIEAEEMLSPRVKATTELPLIGLTTGSDGTWSARFWDKVAPKTYKREWCESVRVVGNGIKVYYNNLLLPPIKFGEEFTRTISAWGESKQSDLARLKIGIIGLGSVGSIVAEGLLRTGFQNIKLVDFDTVEKKNLDRIQGISIDDVGFLKVEVLENRLNLFKLTTNQKFTSIPYSITEPEGLNAALDCDILFSCVDRPLPRFVLDAIAYAHHIPVIDGGIDASINKSQSNLDQARWKAHIVGPERICMKSLGQYTAEEVALEENGDLDDQKYIKGLPREHFINRGENVFSFSMGLAAMEMQQLLSFILQPRGIYYGAKEFDFNTGNIDFDFEYKCKDDCDVHQLLGRGDDVNSMLLSKHLVAEEQRFLARKINNIEKNEPLNWFNKLIQRIYILRKFIKY